ncbi:MAG: glycosyltransferase [Saprospiraceae bacterium]
MDIYFVYVLFSLLLMLLYVVIIWNYMRGWKQLCPWQVPQNFTTTTSVSIIIPARNEADNILLCLHSILKQSYPQDLLQIIVIDDHSTDATPQLVTRLNDSRILLLKLVNFPSPTQNQSFKKQAINLGIQHATGELIITTDADCITPPDWLNLIVSFYEEKNPVFIAAPVNFYAEENALEKFQSLDFMGMMAITGAGIHQGWMHMCNGANLAYPKTAFYAVDGFVGIDHLASGDDMLLMQKIARQFPNRIGFIKNKAATVLTKAKPTLRSFLQQRIRWASKSTAYPEWKVTLVLALVFFFCCNILLALFLALSWKVELFWLVIVQLLVKAITDFVFLKKMATFFDRRDLMHSFASAFFLHTAYIIGVGILGNIIKKYKWKGRKVS